MEFPDTMFTTDSLHPRSRVENLERDLQTTVNPLLYIPIFTYWETYEAQIY